jgi:hypothetical protein
MSIGGPGGINMSNGPGGTSMSIGGPGGINVSQGPNGNSMSIGGPGGVNYTNYGGGDDSDDDDDWEVSGAMVGDPWDWPYGNSYNVNFGSNQNNGSYTDPRGNVFNFGANSGNNYGNLNFGNQNSPFGRPGFPGPLTTISAGARFLSLSGRRIFWRNTSEAWPGARREWRELPRR